MEESFDIIKFLRSAVATGASDEHLRVGHSPYLRINGFVKRTNMPIITLEDLEKSVLKLAPASVKGSILSSCDLDFMFEIFHTIFPLLKNYVCLIY